MMKLADLIKSDLNRFRQTFLLRGDFRVSFIRILCESFLLKSGFRAVLLYRLAHWFYLRGHVYAAWWLTRRNVRSTGAEIEFNARIGPGLMITHPVGIVVGRGTIIGANATLFQGASFGVKNWHPSEIKKFPTVGDNCFVFANAVVIGGITIGNDCVIGANAVVTQDLHDGDMALGNPARILPGRGREHGRALQEAASPPGFQKEKV